MAKKSSGDSQGSLSDEILGSDEAAKPTPKAGLAKKPSIAFEQALSELERIVRQMEAGSMSLEDSLLAYKRGVELVASCRESLTSARQQVKILEGDLMKPFEFDDEA